jgi:UDP-glucose 4-epimerase
MQRQTWIITGGAGYIGSHIADSLLATGKDVILYDSMRSGSTSRIDHLRQKHKAEIPVVVGDIRSLAKFEEMVSTIKPFGIVHSAALKSAPESLSNSEEYFEVNFRCTKELLKVSSSQNVKKFIFSSSAAVYGDLDSKEFVLETDETNPISPYGESKLMAENALNDFLTNTDLQGTSFRFFNVVGSLSPELKDGSLDNLVPKLLQVIKSNNQPRVFGCDYPTKDGSCVRDYVDVRDIANAHVLAIDSPNELPRIMNLGSGIGASVIDVIKSLEKITDRKLEPIFESRRKGDPASLCANMELTKRTLGFNPKFTLEESLLSILK